MLRGGRALLEGMLRVVVFRGDGRRPLAGRLRGLRLHFGEAACRMEGIQAKGLAFRWGLLLLLLWLLLLLLLRKRLRYLPRTLILLPGHLRAQRRNRSALPSPTRARRQLLRRRRNRRLRLRRRPLQMPPHPTPKRIQLILQPRRLLPHPVPALLTRLDRLGGHRRQRALRLGGRGQRRRPRGGVVADGGGWGRGGPRRVWEDLGVFRRADVVRCEVELRGFKALV